MLFAKFSIVILLLVMLGITRVPSSSFFEDIAFDGMELDEPKGFLTCLCGDSNETLTKPIEAKIVENVLSTVAVFHQHVSVVIKSFPSAGNYVPNCKLCQVTYINCTKKSSLNVNIEPVYNCVQSKVKFIVTNSQDDMNDEKITVKREIEVFPNVVYIPPGSHPNNRRRIRQIDTCILPKAMETYALFCVYYPLYVNCTQRCVYGYTLPTGIQQVMDCDYEANQWDPVGFSECEPFVDCTLELVASGSKKCNAGLVTKSTECIIECGFEEDKLHVPPKIHTCKIDGSWEPPLPFCVAPASAVTLVKTPDVALHHDYVNYY